MLKKASVIVATALVVAAAAPRQMVHAETANIVDTAVAAGSFKTLAKALQAADLVTTLTGPGPFTVFAPTDEAFAKLPAGTLETLLKPENKDKLRRVLTYHVVAGKVVANDVVKLQSAKAVSGDTIAVNGAGRHRPCRRRAGHQDGHSSQQRRDSRDRHGDSAERPLTLTQ